MNQNFTRWSWMISSPEMLIKKSINILRFFFLILNKCSLNLVLRARLVCPTYCIPQPPSLQVRTYSTSSDFQSKSELFTTGNCLWLTEEIIVDRQIKWLQQIQLGIALRNISIHTVPFIRILIIFKYRRFNWRTSNSKVITENIIIRSAT